MNRATYQKKPKLGKRAVAEKKPIKLKRATPYYKYERGRQMNIYLLIFLVLAGVRILFFLAHIVLWTVAYCRLILEKYLEEKDG